MTFKLKNTDVIDGTGVIDSQLMPYRTKPTSISHQNLFRNPSPAVGNVFGLNIKIKHGHLYVADNDADQLWAWKLFDQTLSGSNANYSANYIADWQYTPAADLFERFDVGYNRVVGLANISSDDIFHFEATEDKSSIISNGFYGLGGFIRDVAIGNGRLYIGTDTGFSIYEFVEDVDFVTDPTLVKNVTSSYDGDAIVAKHGLVVIIDHTDDVVELYTADGLKIRTLLSGGNLSQAVAAIGCGRIVIGAPNETATGKLFIYNYAGKLINTVVGGDLSSFANASDQLGRSVAIGNDIIAAGDPLGEPSSGAGSPSNSGYVAVFDLDGNNLTSLGQSGIFYYFGLLVSGDQYGHSVDISDGYLAVGIPNEDVDASNEAGGAVVYKVPQTIGEYYDKIFETYRY